MHVRDALAELGPALPAVLHHLDVWEAVEHGVHRAKDNVAAAFATPSRKPKLEFGFVAVRDFERRASRAHQIFQRPRSSESADAQSAAVKQRMVWKGRGFEIVEVGQIDARARVGGAN